MKKEFSGFYLSLTGIIQALAFGYLLEDIRKMSSIWSFNLEAIVIWSRILVIFIIIVLVWFVYITSLLTFRWVIGLADSVIPFAFGTVEFSLIALLQEPLPYWWYYTLTIFGLVAIWAYVNMYEKSTVEKENQKIIHYFYDKKYQSKTKTFLMTACITIFLAGITFHGFDISSLEVLLLSNGLIISFIIFMFYREVKTWLQLTV